MKLNSNFAISFFFISAVIHPSMAAAEEKSSINPPIEACKLFGDHTVKEFGDDLAKIGESPSDIRSTVNYTCLDAIKTALEAKSEKEIEQWRVAKINGLLDLNKDRDQYKSLVINTSAKLADMYYKDKNGSLSMPQKAKKGSDSPSKTINKSSKHDGDTLIVNKAKQCVAVVSYNIEGLGCETQIQDMTISEVIQDKDERHVESMRFKEHQEKLDVNFSGLDNASRSWADKIFKLGDKVSVNIMSCGSGGFESVIGMAIPMTKDFPSAGFQINAQH